MTESVDLRSDTVTTPTPGMRKAMARAKVGDAQRGEDPTVRELEEYSAELFGKEAGFFVPSGTMGNLSAVAAWTRPGDIVVAPAASHIAGRESPGLSNLASVAVVPISALGGIFSAADVAETIGQAQAERRTRVRLVTVENTHNAGGGTVFPLGSLRGIQSLLRRHGIPLHIDGSRIFNASVASGIAAAEYGKTCRSLMFCLSKGLGAPVGSILVGAKDFIEEARGAAFRLGGGMRQAGIVAGGGLYALRHHVARLAEDHENARTLAEALEEIPGIVVVNAPVETNIVLFRWTTPTKSLPEFREVFLPLGVQLDDRTFPLFRAVTHLGIGKKETARAIRALRRTLAR